jgi:CRISPR-associated protein Cmr5
MTTPEGQDQQQNRRRATEQRRGERAWEYVQDAKRRFGKKEPGQEANEQTGRVGQPEMKAGKDESRYRALALGLNAMIQINGFAQTLAFLQAKEAKSEAHKLLFGQLCTWVGERMKLEQPAELLNWLLKTAQRDQYRQATAECMAFGLWLRRFAEGTLEGSNEQSARGDDS